MIELREYYFLSLFLCLALLNNNQINSNDNNRSDFISSSKRFTMKLSKNNFPKVSLVINHTKQILATMSTTLWTMKTQSKELHVCVYVSLSRFSCCFVNPFSIQYLTQKKFVFFKEKKHTHTPTSKNTLARWKKTIKKTTTIKVIDDDIHLNHNDNVTHDFPLYQPK